MKKHYLQEWKIWHLFCGAMFSFLLYLVLIWSLKTIESLDAWASSSPVNITAITIHILFQKIYLYIPFIVTSLLPIFEEQVWQNLNNYAMFCDVKKIFLTFTNLTYIYMVSYKAVLKVFCRCNR